METVAPIPAVDFNFDSACSSPYITAPSSPQRFGNFFFSAPTSPTRVSSLHPPPLPETNRHDDDGGDREDFEFNFSGPLEIAYLSAADELFDGGKIRPLIKPQQYLSSVVSSQDDVQFRSQQCGRETTSGSSSSSYVHKKSRSLSPLRVTDIMFEHEEEEENSSNNSQKNNSKTSSSSLASSILSSISFSKANKKWKFKDLLLFRSASEGRATTGKDPLRKYSLLSSTKKDCSEDVKNASFRSIDSIGSASGSMRRRSGRASAHELHYTANRAVSEEMKRKTFLPYKQGLLGCLGFNPGIHEISKGFGSLTRG